VKFLCEQCKAKYQIADEKAAGKTVRMKCRKCGHLIEVRAAVTETSVSSAPPERSSAPPAPSPPPRPPAGHAAAVGSAGAAGALQSPASRPRAPPSATGRALGKAAPKAEHLTGALEGAFKSAVQHDSVSAALPRRGSRVEEEVSAPFDMSDLSPSDEWYVAINGVPVGPIRVAEIRRKAALGAVTEDSLVWQEGLDEWRALRSFPELAASVREAMSRLSRPPPAEVRSSLPPPPPSRAPGRSVASVGAAPRTTPPRAPPSPLPRSNVVPFMSRLATAERLDEAVQDRTSPVPRQQLPAPQAWRASVAPDPFATAAPAVASPSLVAGPLPSTVPPPRKTSPNWFALAMVAGAVAFGVTAAIAIVIRPAPPPAPVSGTVPGAPSTVAAPATAAVTAPAASEVAEPVTNQVIPAVRGPTAYGGPKAAATATTANPGRSLDLHALTQNSPNVTPIDDSANEAPKPSGQSLTEGQVRQVMALHQVAIGRVCWDRNPTAKSVVNVNVALTVGPDGSAQNVTATGDEPSVTKCIENDVRGWHFPATGSAQKIAIPFKFVRQ
jgi:predicted Zn finger-like uncharacterized protein